MLWLLAHTQKSCALFCGAENISAFTPPVTYGTLGKHTTGVAIHIILYIACFKELQLTKFKKIIKTIK